VTTRAEILDIILTFPYLIDCFDDYPHNDEDYYKFDENVLEADGTVEEFQVVYSACSEVVEKSEDHDVDEEEKQESDGEDEVDEEEDSENGDDLPIADLDRDVSVGRRTLKIRT
jgi:hypothetical protein